mgnify:CR=1 FL=1
MELNIETRDGSKSIAKQTYTPTVNIGNSTSNAFGNLKQQTFQFDITDEGEYAIAVYTADAAWADCIIGQLMLTANSYAVTGIREIQNAEGKLDNVWYSLDGRKLNGKPTSKGIYVNKGKKVSL